jgi:predicted CoA-binding protein
LGVKTSVPSHLHHHAAVYYPDVKEILGQPVVRDLKQIQAHVDVLDVFRRPQDLQQVGGNPLVLSHLVFTVGLQW